MPGRAHGQRRRTPIEGVRVALLAATLLLLAPGVAQAAWTSSISGNTVTMTEDGGGTPLEIGVVGGNLSHNLSGQPGFGNSQDFDTFNVGIQAVANSSSASLVINGGPGNDIINIGDAGTPASAIAASVSAAGGGHTFEDQLQINDGTATADRTFAISPTGVSGLGGAFSYSSFEFLGVQTGAGNDVVNVAAGTLPLLLGTLAGDDRIALADGAQARTDGGAGNDTLDYSAWTTPVSTLPPEFGHFKATLNAGQEVTPSASTATGTVFISVDLATGELDFIFADASGITPAQEAGSHIQLGAPGVQDAIIFDLETGPQPDAVWSPTAGGMTLNSLTAGIFPPSRLPDLVTGNTFVNIRSTNARCGAGGNQACTEGEIRGQLEPSDIGFTADSSSGVFNAIENIVGGAAGDTINGNPVANVIDGGPGNDIVRGAERGDDVSGGPGADDIGGGSGDDRLRANDGEADTSIDCGPGADIADRDPAHIDPDSILIECESVNTTLPPGAISRIKAKVKRNRDGTFTIVTGAVAECPPTASAKCELTARASARVEVGQGKRTLRKRRVTLGRLGASVAPGDSQRVRIKLSRKGSRRFAANDPLPVRMKIDLEVPSGQPATLQRSQRLKAPKRRR